MKEIVYTDLQYEIHKLSCDNRYSLIVEVYKDDGRLIAGLFKLEEDSQ
ncbi:hypothetical protein [[Bacillus] enclensis]|nr:hypothetical protein [[Bacillus] enclensis]MBH9965585.1 hypothetical protein [[Bacillus] enclensis]